MQTAPPNHGILQRLAAWQFFAAQLIAFGVGLWLTIPAEVVKFRAALATKIGLWAWFYLTDVDTTFPFVLMAIVPAVWFIRRRAASPAENDSTRKPFRRPAETNQRLVQERTSENGGEQRAWIMAAVCFVASIAASAWVAAIDVRVAEDMPPVQFGSLPPAVHDEFSYLFQAKTFLAGHLSFASSPRMPELFDQMHVLNEGRFASKYFPGVGLWLAPFLAIGHPYWAEWFAGGLTAFFIFWAGRELAGNTVGLTAGLLTALSPGMALFCNLLLSHGPTMAALSVFLFAFLRFIRTGRASDAFCAGCGLSFAMLCRPMTAAGFGLPFGLWFVWHLVAQLRRGGVPTLFACTALGAPFAIALGGLFVYDRAITGNGFVTPYSLYGSIYTPSHVYGFNNALRNEANHGPKVLDGYNRWATNLTPAVAADNVQKRAKASAEWTLGPVPIAMAILIFATAVIWQVEWRWGLVAASVVSLHAVHVPFWLSGIMNWNYVLETAPLLLLIFAVTSRELVTWWRQRRQVLMPVWWAALVASSVIINWVPFDPFWSPRVEAGVEELARARVNYARFDGMLDRSVTKRPALVLIEADPNDVHTDYVVNNPDLAAPLLRARYRPGKTDVKQVRAAFPDRALYLFRAASGQFVDLSP
jgi:hypothetical protein